MKKSRKICEEKTNTIAIYAMADNNKDAVQKIYAASPHQPKTIESLDIINAYGLGPEVYENCIEQLVEVVPIKVQEAVRR